MDAAINRYFPEWGAGSIRRLKRHRNQGLEIVWLARGHLRWQVEGRFYDLKPGAVFFTFPWEIHGSRTEFEPGHHWHYVVIRLREGKSSSRRKNLSLPSEYGLGAKTTARLFRVLLHSKTRCVPAGQRLPKLITMLEEELSRGDSWQKEMSLSLSRSLLLELAQQVGRYGAPGETLSHSREDPIEKALRIVRERCDEKWTLASLGALTGLSRTRLADRIKEQTGDSPINFINRVRLDRAQRLLRTTQKSVTEIAFECGFSSGQYFARLFRRQTEMTPGEYRAQK